MNGAAPSNTPPGQLDDDATVLFDEASVSGRDSGGESNEQTPQLSDALSRTLARTAAGGGFAREGAGWGRLSQFLRERTVGGALRAWLGLGPDAPVIATEQERADLADRLNADIAYVDGLLNDQVNAIIHHSRFQKLEASWRGLHYLAVQSAESPGVKIRMLNLSWMELCRDQDRAIEFDQSQLFNKIYNEEFGSPGGEPYGVILGDYEISHRTEVGDPVDDLAALRGVSHVAAAAFAPFITGAHPALLGMDSFAELGRPVDLARTFEQKEYLKWRAFRETDDARFVGVTLPRVLMREPYRFDGTRVDRFNFREDVRGPDASRYLWGNAVYAFGSVLTRAYGESGWLARIQGVTRGEQDGGLVTDLPLASFATDPAGVAPKYSTDVLVTDAEEKALSELGLLPLSHCKDTPHCAFYGSASVQKPQQYDRLIATTNARMSAMLQCVFSVSRFAHYLKVIGRDKVGSFSTPEQCENYLQRWLHEYTIDADDATLEAKAKAPLRDGRVEVSERPGRPGSYQCVMHLQPHFQLDQVSMALRLVTEMAPASG